MNAVRSCLRSSNRVSDAPLSTRVEAKLVLRREVVRTLRVQTGIKTGPATQTSSGSVPSSDGVPPPDTTPLLGK